MPIISVKKRLLDQHLQKVYTRAELDELCFAYGLEIDDVVSERNDDGIEEDVYKIELPANRCDLLCVEGLCKALLIFQQKLKSPNYVLTKPEKLRKIIIKPETVEIRRYAIGAILRGVHFDKDRYASFIDLQDKLHQNICRKRALASIGTHDLDTITGDVTYYAKKPTDIVFRPLNQQREFNAAELMDFYAVDSHLREYLPIIRDKPLYPVFYDESGTLLSLPPIINSDKTKITLKTRNIFIEATGTNPKKLEIVLDTLVTIFGQYCSTPFAVEPVQVVYPDGSTQTYPTLRYWEMDVDLKRMNAKIGINLSVDEAAKALTRMGLVSTTLKAGKLRLKVPPTRHDILHECDIAEDLGLAFGFNNIARCLPESNTVAEPLALNKLTDGLREAIAMSGWTEVLTFSLCSTEDVTTRLRKPADATLADVVKIANPKTVEFQVVRNSLLPGILKTLASNRDMPIPLRLFEVQDVVFKDGLSETGCRNERHLCAVYYSKTGGFEVIQGLLDRVMQLLEAKPVSTGGTARQTTYAIREANVPTFFDGRCADVSITTVNGTTHTIGSFGVLHPEVLANFGLSMPCSALELNVEPLFQ